MSTSSLALGVVIGGTVSSSFGSSLKNATTSILKFDTKIKKLQQSKIALRLENNR